MEEVFGIKETLLLFEANLEGNEELPESCNNQVEAAHVGKEVGFPEAHSTLQLLLHHHTLVHQVTRHLQQAQRGYFKVNAYRNTEQCKDNDDSDNAHS